ncbi:CDP-glucose 4,6-dehydratase [Enhydrobacter aerosaccus]|uniref:CDP-glucose 4,6-dehydratase n=1 Tax=Enhydrobacter aerosaccus TaxID=225324 RepID=A0A1T4T7T2_9HYPH|nr:CDP-glucose 4,6-dehydratase [Enhydrobacter aerosaccus]SKA36291.1 CDP-glucose 4,6-dehydratase [Enhydrobacter aerosaccus]
MAKVGLPSPDFWRGRRVFITGHTGFKGGWLSLWLEQLGAHVTGYALPPDHMPSLCELADVESAVQSVRGDICDAVALASAMEAACPQVIFHLAAQPLVQRSYAEPKLTFETNVIGTLNVLEAVRNCPTVDVVVSVTTDKVYENKEWVWAYRETDMLGGYDPYSSSKACAELVVAAWRRSYFSSQQNSQGVAIASVRAGNVFGGGDWSENRLVPDCIRAFQKGSKVLIRNPHATRPWQHILEPLCGYLLLAECMTSDRDAYATAWNFGPDLSGVKPVNWIVDRMVSEWGDGASWSLEGNEHPHEASLLAVDATLARSRLGWSPKLPLSEAIGRTVSWYRKQAEGHSAKELVISDIRHYESI